jgi:hypothetical protein
MKLQNGQASEKKPFRHVSEALVPSSKPRVTASDAAI